jgi:hypothetical protein
MLSYNFIHLIQYHSDTPAAGFLRKVKKSERAESYCNASPEELKERVYEIYHHGAASLDVCCARKVPLFPPTGNNRGS